MELGKLGREGEVTRLGQPTLALGSKETGGTELAGNPSKT